MPQWAGAEHIEQGVQRDRGEHHCPCQINIAGQFPEKIETDKSFYALGGDSLTALLITHEINKRLNLKIPFSI